jgi:ABC-type sugar transport system substrate-binding protein
MSIATRILAGLILATALAAPAQAAKAKSSDAVWYDRIVAGCKAEAKKYYSAIHFRKRQRFVKHCIDRAYR